MNEKKNIAFIRLDILELARHFVPYRSKGDYEGAGREILSIVDALVSLDPSINEYAADLMEEAIAFQNKKKDAGRKGGQAKARNAKAAASQATETQPTPKTNNLNQNRTAQRKKPPTKEEVYDFAHDHNLDEADAREWFERNFVDRPGCDENGEVIRNWPGALIRSCQAAKKKREKQQ